MAEEQDQQGQQCSPDNEPSRGKVVGSDSDSPKPESTSTGPVGKQPETSSTDANYNGLLEKGWTADTISTVQQATHLSTQTILAASSAGLNSGQMLAAARGDDSSSLETLKSFAASGTSIDQYWCNCVHLASICNRPVDWYYDPEYASRMQDELPTRAEDAEQSAAPSCSQPEISQSHHKGPAIKKKKTAAIRTMGKIFNPPGLLIEQTQGDRLLVWDQGELQTVSTYEIDDQAYSPARLDPSLAELYLPDRTEPFGDIRQLFTKTRAQFLELGSEEQSSWLLAGVVLCSWVHECLPGPLLINITGANGAESLVVSLLACLCRRAIRVANVSLPDLCTLPDGFSPTLILNRPTVQTLRHLVAAAEPGTHLVSRGKLCSIRCPIVVCTPTPLNIPAVQIPVLPLKNLERLTSRDVFFMADEFQPQLLRYRLEWHAKVAYSQFSGPHDFRTETRTVATVLGAALEGAPEIQRSIVESLRISDAQRKEEESQSSSGFILNRLLSSCHSQLSGMPVAQLALLVTADMRVRHENVVLSPKAVGEILRHELGLFPRRRSAGYELAFDDRNQRRIHHLASNHGVLEWFPSCALCREISPEADGQSTDT